MAAGVRITFSFRPFRSEGSSQQCNTSRWLELPYLGVDFKRVSAVVAPSSGSPGGGTGGGAAGPSSGASSTGTGGRLWALGGDHQVYVFVFGVEVPIRVQEVKCLRPKALRLFRRKHDNLFYLPRVVHLREPALEPAGRLREEAPTDRPPSLLHARRDPREKQRLCQAPLHGLAVGGGLVPRHQLLRKGAGQAGLDIRHRLSGGVPRKEVLLQLRKEEKVDQVLFL